MLVVYIRLGVHPFGELSVMTTDMGSQYADFYQGLRDMLAGETSPFFSWHMALGSNYWGLFTYYLSSPLSLIVLLTGDILSGILVMTLVKIGLCGLSFGIFLRRALHLPAALLPLLATAYALMSYVVLYAMMPMWLDSVALLPLMALGVHSLLGSGRRLPLIGWMAASIFCNYYTGYMAILFTCLYFLYRLLLADGLTRRMFLRKTGQFTQCLLSAGGLGAVVLLPAFLSLREGRLTVMNLNFQGLSPVTFGGKLLGGVYDGIRYDATPSIYCGAAILLLCVGFFFLRNASLREKLIHAGMALLLVMCFCLPAGNGVFHMLQSPAWFLYRYAFIFPFFLVSLAGASFSKMKSPPLWGILATAAIYTIIALLQPAQDPTNLLATVSFLTCAGGALTWYIGKAGTRMAIPAVILLTAVVAADMFVNADALITSLHRDSAFLPYAGWEDMYGRVRPVVEGLRGADDGFYRVEKDFQRTYNDAISLGYKGIAHYSSAYKDSTNRFLRELGMQQGWFWCSHKGSTLAMDTLLGVKYMLSQDGAVFGYDEWFTQNGVTVWQNGLALPPAYMAPPSFSLSPPPEGDPFTRQNNLLGSLCPDVGDCFLPVGYERVGEGAGADADADAEGVGADADADAGITYFVQTPADGLLYLYLDTATHYARVMVSVEGAVAGNTYEEPGVNYMMCLGAFPAGQTVTVAVYGYDGDTGDAIQADGWVFAMLDSGRLETVAARIRQGGLRVTETRANGLSGIVEAREGGVLFTSIPYDSGWSATVGGQPVQTEAYDDALLCVRLPAGTHEVAFSYWPPGMMAGGVTALATLIVLAGWATLSFLRLHRQNHPRASRFLRPSRSGQSG